MKGIKLIMIVYILVFIIGMTVLGSGILDCVKYNYYKNNFTEIDGYFTTYEIYDESLDKYTLTYSYRVNGKEYTITTDSGLDGIPEYETPRKVFYNKNDPSEADFYLPNEPDMSKVVIGIFFVLMISLMMFLTITSSGVVIARRELTGAAVGFVFALVGIIVIMALSYECGGIMELAMEETPLFVILGLFVVLGSFLFISSVTSYKKA